METYHDPRQHLGSGTRNLFRRNVPPDKSPNPSRHVPSQSAFFVILLLFMALLNLDYPGLPWIFGWPRPGFARIHCDPVGFGAIRCD